MAVTSRDFSILGYFCLKSAFQDVHCLTQLCTLELLHLSFQCLDKGSFWSYSIPSQVDTHPSSLWGWQQQYYAVCKDCTMREGRCREMGNTDTKCSVGWASWEPHQKTSSQLLNKRNCSVMFWAQRWQLFKCLYMHPFIFEVRNNVNDNPKLADTKGSGINWRKQLIDLPCPAQYRRLIAVEDIHEWCL